MQVGNFLECFDFFKSKGSHFHMIEEFCLFLSLDLQLFS